MRLESSIQSDILKYLKRFGFVYKHEPSPAGIPDIHLILNGKSIWFEVKRSKKHKPTPLQLYQHQKLRDAGAEVYVVWSLKQVKKLYSNEISK